MCVCVRSLGSNAYPSRRLYSAPDGSSLELDAVRSSDAYEFSLGLCVWVDGWVDGWMGEREEKRRERERE